MSSKIILHHPFEWCFFKQKRKRAIFCRCIFYSGSQSEIKANLIRGKRGKVFPFFFFFVHLKFCCVCAISQFIFISSFSHISFLHFILIVSDNWGLIRIFKNFPKGLHYFGMQLKTEKKYLALICWWFLGKFKSHIFIPRNKNFYYLKEYLHVYSVSYKYKNLNGVLTLKQ